MAQRTELREAISDYIQGHKYVMLQGLPAVGKTTFAYEAGIKIYYECILINCESDNAKINALKEMNPDDPKLLYELANCNNEPYLENESDEPLDNVVFLFDNIDRCREIPDQILDILFQTKANVFLTYTVNTSVVKRTKEKIAAHLGLDTNSAENDENPIVSYPFNFTLWPYSFHDYVEEFGDSEVLLPTIAHSVATMTKIPKLIYDNANIVFDEYLYWGGFPGCIRNYIYSDLELDTIISQQSNLPYYYYVIDMLLERGEADLRIRSQCRAIIDAIIKQMLSGDGYIKFNLAEIRDGATMQYYHDSFEFLTENNLLIPLDRYDNDSGIPTFYFCDCGMLYSMLLHNKKKYCTDKNADELIRYLCLRNYVVQEAKRTGHDMYFWKSRYMANVDLITYVNDKMIAFKVVGGSSRKCRTPESFTEAFPDITLYLVTDANILERQFCYNIPYYAIFDMLNTAD
jgi:hypothetical protein